MSNKHYAIVGAGLAGSVAAFLLEQKGIYSTVIEREHGVGGRLATLFHDGEYYDYGAQYVTITDDKIRQILLDEKKVYKINSKEFIGLPRASDIVKTILNSCKKIKISTNSTIASLKKTNEADKSSWHLELESGDSMGPFDGVIITAPAPEAAMLVADIKSEWADDLKKVEFDSALKMMLSLPSRDWDNWVHHHLDRDLSYAWLYHSVSPEIKTVSCEHLKPGRPNRPAWVISSGLTFCNQHLDDNQENAIDLIIKRLCETFGLPEDMVNNYHVLHRWRYSKVKKALDKGFLWDDSLNLGVCGDSLIGSLGQDAIESSVRLVDNCFNS